VTLGQRPRHRVFVDTSAFFALVAPRDAHHHIALAVRRRMAAEHWHLFTTDLIVAETHALTLARLGRRIALRIVADIDQGTVTVIRPSSADGATARGILRRYEDKDFSLTDATSFAVMERLGIPFAFAFDRNFAQYGLSLLTSA